MGMVPDQYADKATGAFFRQPAWHMLGETFTDEVTDYNEMLKRANMAGQNIRKVEITEVAGIPAERFAQPHVAVVRTNPVTGQDEVIGWASPEYEVRQVEEIFSWAQFGPTEGARWETAGQMKGGSQVFGSIAFEREIVLDPNGAADVTKTFLMVAGSFDGSLANYARYTPVRVVCENTLNIALGGKVGNGFSFKSTKNIRERVGLWQAAVAGQAKYMDAFEKEAKALYAKKVTKGLMFQTIIPAIFPKPEKDVKGSFQKWDNRVEKIAALWNGKTNENLPDNGWKAFNVLTEHNQWDRGLRAGNVENFAVAGAGFDNATNAFRNKALLVVKSA
jgi:phage/plasmid-like protein (TIGR03299 family)